MSQSARVPSFLPSTNGFHFTNSWPSEPAIKIGSIGIGDASNGLCGGMAYAVRDYFESGLPIPLEAANPAAGSPLYAYIVQRLIDSFDIPSGVANYYLWQQPLRNQFKDTVQDEWPKIKRALDAGQLVALGLMRVHTADLKALGKNHQVLTYGYDMDDAQHVTLHLCDPNHADHDDVTLSFSAGNPGGTPDMAYAVGGRAAVTGEDEFTLACFVTPYRHVTPTGLVWPDVPRVIGLNSAGHLLEVSLPVGGAWAAGDLTVLAAAPAADSPASGYVSWADRTDRVVFRSADSHIHEVSLPPGGVWTIGDLSALSGAPAAEGAPFGYVTFFDHVPRVVYRGSDGHIHEIRLPAGHSWTTTDLSGDAEGAPAAGDPRAYTTFFDRTARVLYRTDVGDIGELSMSSGMPWTYDNLMQQAAVPGCAGDPMGYVNPLDDTARVVYRSADGAIWELSLPPGGQWTAGNLSQLSAAHPAAGDPFGYVTSFDQTSRVVYRGTDGHIHEISLPPHRSWTMGDLTHLAAAPGAAGEPSATVSPLDRTARVVYRGTDGHLNEISLAAGRSWFFGDLTSLTHSAAEVTDPHAYIG
jgi:hypothetical protein